LAVTTPRGAWVALFFWSFLAVLALGCAIPHRPAAKPPIQSRSHITTETKVDSTRAHVTQT
jgi:hypothetical protein